MFRPTIRGRLILTFTLAILIPSVIAGTVGVKMIREQVYLQAQTKINSDLEGAREIWRTSLERLKDAIRIHATRMILYRALDRRERDGLGAEMERIIRAEGLDILTLTDVSGRIFYRTRNPEATGDDRADDPLVSRVIWERVPVFGTVLVPETDLALESPDLAAQALMLITPTPYAAPSRKTRETSGMMLKAAAPVFSTDGRFLGVLYGGVLINRNYELVDKIRRIVFKDELYDGRDVGTVTVFLDDVRISTNVRNESGARAIATRVSAEVAEEVLNRGNTYRGRAFVVTDWYITAYEPIRDTADKTIGMLYVGTLERPFTDSLERILYTFLGITLLGVVLVGVLAVIVAQRISRPLRMMTLAAKHIAEGDYSPRVEVTSRDEIGYLAESFNRMVQELAKANQDLRDWASTLEIKIGERTEQVKAMQRHLMQSEKLAAIGMLAAGVAHEINNPLTGILTNSSLLVQDIPPDDPRREDLQTIVDETLRCRKIVKGLLDFARQTKPQKQLFQLNSAAEDVLSLIRNQAAFRNIRLAAELDPGLPLVTADRDQIRQVILNAVLNAAEAMPGGGSIVVGSRQVPGSGELEIKIADDGPGVPEEIRSKLFEPFFTTKRTGTGLGLAIAYGIMEQHGGTIEVESTQGKGTTVLLRLPSGGKEDHG